ncbi:hypothetical protein CEXT_679161 [Caerostris extrusa]|uniref:Uncharacterized protein n=1 Tax=Caerostris extrusa TaxID=172846 RepID=A0AAV4SSZ1_CAEEX|nr:hypothetical protein CEXT_679161 [Caerostris extrusa]
MPLLEGKGKGDWLGLVLRVQRWEQGFAPQGTSQRLRFPERRVRRKVTLPRLRKKGKIYSHSPFLPTANPNSVGHFPIHSYFYDLNPINEGAFISRLAEIRQKRVGY